MSRAAVLVWAGQYGVAATAVAIAGLQGYVKLLILLAVLISAGCTRPRACPRLAVGADGRWALPEASLGDLRILPATQFTQWWVLLHLGRSDGVRRRLRIWRDTFAPEDWRRIVILLREYRGNPS